ncbi:MAG: hypothetical protein IJU16_07235 [Clostridia bacterium]|nr:hypothetical protein [Clostridia bacterium]
MLWLSVPPEEEERPSSSGTVIFTIVFLVSLVVFGTIGFFWWQHTEHPSLAAPAQTATSETVAPLFSEKDSRTVAVYLTDDAGVLQTMTLLKADPTKDAMTAAGFPAELLLNDESGETLKSCYASGGIEAVQTAVKSYFSLTDNYCVVFRYQQVQGLLLQMKDGLNIEIGEDVHAQSKNYALHLAAGWQSLTPEQAANLLQYNAWQGGRRAQANMHAAMIAAFCNQYLVAGRDGQTDYAAICSFSGTNIREIEWQSSQMMLSYLAQKNTGSICTTLAVDGAFEGAGDTLVFTPFDNVLAVVKES